MALILHLFSKWPNIATRLSNSWRISSGERRQLTLICQLLILCQKNAIRLLEVERWLVA